MTASYPGQLDTVALLIQIGDGGSPEVFAHPVLINQQRSYSKKSTSQATVVPRTDDPTQPGKTVRLPVATDSEISGDGIMDAASAKIYNDKVGTIMNIKVQLGSATGNLIVTGPYTLEDFTITGQKKGDLVTVALKFAQADDPTSSAHA